MDPEGAGVPGRTDAGVSGLNRARPMREPEQIRAEILGWLRSLLDCGHDSKSGTPVSGEWVCDGCGALFRKWTTFTSALPASTWEQIAGPPLARIEERARYAYDHIVPLAAKLNGAEDARRILTAIAANEPPLRLRGDLLLCPHGCRIPSGDPNLTHRPDCPYLQAVRWIVEHPA